MEAATRSLQTRDLDGAESSVDEVLAVAPENQRAQVLKERIAAARKRRNQFRLLMMLGAAALVVVAGLTVLTRKLMKKKSTEDKVAKVAAAQRKAVLKIIDGVGRGKLFTIEGDIFRIGAAVSERAEERNDLVVSDSAALVSRYHCSILRKGADYFLLDSSLNGTALNGDVLERGEDHPLEDGDEFTIAQVARLKFVKM